MVRKLLTGVGLLVMAVGVITPVAAKSDKSKSNSLRRLVSPVAVDGRGDANAIGKFNRHEKNKKLFKVNGRVTAVSASSITVQVSLTNTNNNGNANGNSNANASNVNADVTLKSFTFSVDSNTAVIRKFKGTATIDEVAVGDHVRVWATKRTDGRAVLIWDKSIWWVHLKGVISSLDATAKTFKLTVTIKGIEYTTNVKTNDATTYWLDATAKTFGDLANGQTVLVKGSWNSVGKYVLAKKVLISP